MPTTASPETNPPPAVALDAAAGRLTVVSAIERTIPIVVRDQTEDTPGQCLYFAHAVATVLHLLGLRPVIQAGSMQWPRMRREEDDGVTNTHFAYMWQPDHPESIMARAVGALPEIHVWVGLVETQELIDFSTRHFRRHAEACGVKWTAEDPPAFLWAPAASLPDWVLYTPDRDATLYAASVLGKLFHPKYLER